MKHIIKIGIIKSLKVYFRQTTSLRGQTQLDDQNISVVEYTLSANRIEEKQTKLAILLFFFSSYIACNPLLDIDNVR